MVLPSDIVVRQSYMLYKANPAPSIQNIIWLYINLKWFMVHNVYFLDLCSNNAGVQTINNGHVVLLSSPGQTMWQHWPFKCCQQYISAQSSKDSIYAHFHTYGCGFQNSHSMDDVTTLSWTKCAKIRIYSLKVSFDNLLFSN